MFKVEGYRIRFEKRYLNNQAMMKGRFDTLCEIYRDGQIHNAGCGIARLHPNDNPDRIVGKRIALAKALATVSELSNGYLRSKKRRTIIWKAFLVWVKSWKKREHTIELVDGNLAFCTTCKGGEGSLTTECCGRPITEEESNRVYKKALDFINGKWTWIEWKISWSISK